MTPREKKMAAALRTVLGLIDVSNIRTSKRCLAKWEAAVDTIEDALDTPAKARRGRYSA